MAIIYETKEDFEREKLKDQSNDLYLKSANQSGIGLGAFIFGSIAHDINRGNEKSGILGLVGIGLMAVGAVELVKAFFTGHKAHSLKLERDRMGPHTVIFPPDVATVSDMAVVGDNDCCDKKKHSHAVQPKTLLAQAEKHISTLGRE